MEHENIHTQVKYTLSGDSNTAGYTTINSNLQNLIIVTENSHRLDQAKDGETSLLNIHIVHELNDLEAFKEYLETSEVDLIVLTFDTDSSSKTRAAGHKTAQLLALNKNILLKKYHLDNFLINFKENLMSTFENLIWYAKAGGSSNQDPKFVELWTRYIHANHNFKLY